MQLSVDVTSTAPSSSGSCSHCVRSVTLVSNPAQPALESHVGMHSVNTPRPPAVTVLLRFSMQHIVPRAGELKEQAPRLPRNATEINAPFSLELGPRR